MKNKYKVGDKVVVIRETPFPRDGEYVGKVSEVLEDPYHPNDPCAGDMVLLAYNVSTRRNPSAFELEEVVSAEIYNSPLYKAMCEEE